MKFEIVETSGNKIIQKTDADGTVWTVPTDPANSDYQAYLAWVAEGNEAPIIELEEPETTSDTL
jgi:hypothetical protein